MGAGRPKTEINSDLLGKLAAIPRIIVTNEQIVDMLCASGNKVSLSTLQRYINKTHGVNFDQYREQKASTWKASLFSNMLSLALKGNVVMSIWLSKQYLGMSDKLESKTEVAATVKQETTYTTEWGSNVEPAAPKAD